MQICIVKVTLRGGFMSGPILRHGIQESYAREKNQILVDCVFGDTGAGDITQQLLGGSRSGTGQCTMHFLKRTIWMDN